MHFIRIKHILIGLILGILLTISTSTLLAANTSITAFLMGNVTFEFNGQKQKLPEGYSVLNYKDRVYVPARFVAENLGATVDWNNDTKTVILNKEIGKVEDTQPTDNKDPQTNKTYNKLPYKRYDQDKIITFNTIEMNEEYTRVYFAIENKSSSPLQLVQNKTKIFVDGKEYFIRHIESHRYDVKWYNNIEKDQTVEGYIIFPEVFKDSEKLDLTLTILTNDGSNKTEEVEFNILF